MAKTTEDLRRFYDSELAPDLNVLEEARKKIAGKLVLIGALIALVFAVSSVLYYTFTVNNDVRFYLFAIFGSVALWLFVLKALTRNYVSDFKSKIIHRIVGFIAANLNYEKENYVSQVDFINCGIFRKKPDRYKGDDRVTGTIDSTGLEFSEIHAEYVTRDSKGRTNYHTIFKGLFFIADFNKSFSGKTFILPDATEWLLGQFGSMLQSLNKGRGELIKLEDPEFEKLFVVYGDDQVEARYILSTSLMKRIVDFKNKSNKVLHISFVGSKIFIAISYSKDLFEPRIFQTLLDFKPVLEYYEDLELAIGIVEDLNLNLRIWSKR